MKYSGRAWALCMLLSAAACNGSKDGGGGDEGTAPPQAASCRQAFSPEKLAAGEDCAPAAGETCPAGSGLEVLSRDPIACYGVSTSEYTITAADRSSDYYVLSGPGHDYEAVYVALHYLFADKGAFANIVRLPELAKARKVLVIVPQAPALLSLSRWPTGTALDRGQVAPTIQWLQAVVSDARSRFGVLDSVPQYVAGLSNGAVMAYLYGCADPRVKAVLAVASDANPTSFETVCTADHPLGSVIVHGTRDLTTPYQGLPLDLTLPIPEVHEQFRRIDDCAAADASVAMPTLLDDLLVTIAYTAPGVCRDAYRNFLVTVDGGGHNWPGNDTSVTLGNILFGAHTGNFDATLQGYDLLRLAAGD